MIGRMAGLLAISSTG